MMLYYQLSGDDATVHYIWSLQGSPTLLLYISNVTASEFDCKSINSTIDWSKFPSNVTLPGFNTSRQSFAITFKRLYEFNDVNFGASSSFNPGDIHNMSVYRNVSLEGLTWNFTNTSGDQILTGYNFEPDADDTLNTTWQIKINVPVEGDERLPYFPKTLYTVNSTTFDFTFINFTYKISTAIDNVTNFGRLILEMTVVPGSFNTSALNEEFSLDDEYTPSIFRTHNYKFGGTDGGYLQWKPISYLTPDRKSTSSQQVNLKYSTNASGIDIPYGLASELFNVLDLAGNVTTTYLVFGTEKDDNSPNPEYLTWTCLMGFGKVPQDHISIGVIITIIVGLGVPAALILLGSVFVVVKKKPWDNFKKINYSKVSQSNDNNTDEAGSGSVSETNEQ
jgi:hypothetical protein